MKQLLMDYVITFGWAIVGSLSMGFSLLLTLFIVSKFTTVIDEEAEL